MAKKKSNPNRDDRTDNVKSIKYNINQTRQNMEAAEELLQKTDDSKMRQELKEKNKHRAEALKGLSEEAKDEAKTRKSGHR